MPSVTRFYSYDGTAAKPRGYFVCLSCDRAMLAGLVQAHACTMHWACAWEERRGPVGQWMGWTADVRVRSETPKSALRGYATVRRFTARWSRRCAGLNTQGVLSLVQHGELRVTLLADRVRAQDSVYYDNVVVLVHAATCCTVLEGLRCYMARQSLKALETF